MFITFRSQMKSVKLKKKHEYDDCTDPTKMKLMNEETGSVIYMQSIYNQL